MSAGMMGLIIALGGLFSCAGALGNWDWFMSNRKAWIFVKLLGRNGARIFYFVLGLALVALGIYVAIAAPA